MFSPPLRKGRGTACGGRVESTGLHNETVTLDPSVSFAGSADSSPCEGERRVAMERHSEKATQPSHYLYELFLIIETG